MTSNKELTNFAKAVAVALVAGYVADRIRAYFAENKQVQNG